jgi:hypothetical protein
MGHRRESLAVLPAGGRQRPMEWKVLVAISAFECARGRIKKLQG